MLMQKDNNFVPHESHFGMYKCKKDISFSKLVLLDGWKAKNTSLKQPNKQMDMLKKKKEYFAEHHKPKAHAWEIKMIIHIRQCIL